MKIFSQIALAFAFFTAAAAASAQQAVESTSLASENLSAGGAVSYHRAYSTDTSPCAKILQVVRKGACTAAAENLATLRHGTESYEYFTNAFREEMAITGLKLQDFKTSEAELQELRVFGAKLSALRYLVVLRKGTPSYKHFLHSLREELKTGGLNPADIGASEFELEDMRQSKN